MQNNIRIFKFDSTYHTTRHPVLHILYFDRNIIPDQVGELERNNIYFTENFIWRYVSKVIFCRFGFRPST